MACEVDLPVVDSYGHFPVRLVARLCACVLVARREGGWTAEALLHPSGAGRPASTNLPSPPMQLSLRLKAMKRQVEEAEEEIDRLESSKKKLQRELEEQMDVNEQLQGQLNSMKKDLR